jgi:predicted dehydrogenase
VPLWVGFYRRQLPRFLKVKELVDGGAIGAVRLVASRHVAPLETVWSSNNWRTDPSRSGGGLFFESGCHTMDFLDFLFGPIEQVRSHAVNQAGKYKAEDTVAASYRFASGVMGSGAWCFASDHSYEMNEIIGASGRILFSTTRAVPIRLYRGDAMEEFPIEDPPHVHQPMIQTIVDEMNGVGTCVSTGETAARTAWVMDQVLGEYYPGRERIDPRQ